MSITNHISQGGLRIAQHIATLYKQNPAVEVMFLGGSVSRGYADTYSDLELGVFWNRPPTDTERTTAVTRFGGELWSFTSYDTHTEWVVTEHVGLHEIIVEDQHVPGTLMLSINHFTTTGMERCLSDVVDHSDTSLAKQTLLAAIEHGHPLLGAKQFHTWQQRLRLYPDTLAIKMVQENLWFGPWCVPHAYANRNDMLVLYQHFIWMQQSLVKILAALNRLYIRSEEFKWFEQTIARFSFAPLQLAARMQHIFQTDLTTGADEMQALIMETLALIDQHLPAVNTTPLFPEHPEVTTTWARQRWQVSAPYTLMQAVGNLITGEQSNS